MKPLVLACLLCIATPAATTADNAPRFERFAFESVEMAVPVKIILYAPDRDSAKRAADAAFDRIRQLNGILSDYDSKSELRRLCETAGSGRAVPVGDDLWRVLTAAQVFSKQSDGAFDITVGPVVRLWRRARRQRRLPSADRLRTARQLVGHQLVAMDPKTRSVRLARAGMRLDLGGIAKGYATDEALAVLQKHRITRALVDAGGDIRLGDPPPDRRGWRIGVAPLDAKAGASLHLWLSNCAVATSGDAWQFVEIRGVRYSHIVDPRTGLGLTDHSSVTIVAPDGITADALASAVSVLGPDKGIALADRTAGVAALVVRAPQGKTERYESQRWKKLPVARLQAAGPSER